MRKEKSFLTTLPLQRNDLKILLRNTKGNISKSDATSHERKFKVLFTIPACEIAV